MAIKGKERKSLGILAAALLGLGAWGGLEARAQTVTPTTAWTNPATITWNWTQQYKVGTGSIVNGSAEITGDVDSESYVDQGDEVTFTANADDHYHFSHWTGLPASVTNVNPATFNVSAAWTNAIANFAIDQVALTQTSEYSTVSWDTSNVNYGSTAAIDVGTLDTYVTNAPGQRVRRAAPTITGNEATYNP